VGFFGFGAGPDDLGADSTDFVLWVGEFTFVIVGAAGFVGFGCGFFWVGRGRVVMTALVDFGRRRLSRDEDDASSGTGLGFFLGSSTVGAGGIGFCWLFDEGW
jgi:hypothetical protein